MLKILYLILFYLIYRVTDIVLLVLMLIQTGLNIFTGEPSESMKQFGRSLGAYLEQISTFLSYANEEKPFPFSDWPDAKVNRSSDKIGQVIDVTAQNDPKGDAVEMSNVSSGSALEEQGPPNKAKITKE